MMLVVCSSSAQNATKKFTLNGKSFDVIVTYVTTNSISINLNINGRAISMVGIYLKNGVSTQYVNTNRLVMEIPSYSEAFTITEYGVKVSAQLIGSAGLPTVIISIESYKFI